MKTGLRKWTLGMAFLGCVTFITHTAIINTVELIGLSTVIGAIAVGIGGLVWGFNKEHEGDSPSKKNNYGAPPVG